MLVHLTEENFDETINSGKPVLVDFWAEWCGPCKMVGPIVEGLVEDVGDSAIIAKVDVEKAPELAKRFGISSIPNIKIFKDGAEVNDVVGVVPAQKLKSMLTAAGA
jgi:thioredoxin 1